MTITFNQEEMVNLLEKEVTNMAERLFTGDKVRDIRARLFDMDKAKLPKSFSFEIEEGVGEKSKREEEKVREW